MRAEAERLLATEWRHWSDTPAQCIKALEGGLTNTSFLIDASGQKMVLRINAANSDALDLNRAAEANALRLASDQNLCAPLIYVDADYRFIVTGFIEGNQLELSQSTHIAELAQFLRQIHRLPTIPTQLNIASKAHQYWQSIAQNSAFFLELSRLHQCMQPLLEQTHAQPNSRCLCHNDLLPANLFMDHSGHIKAIDWEYAATGDPFFDLATIVQGYALNLSRQRLLLCEYLQRPPTHAELSRLNHWQKIYRYLSVLWYALQSEQPGFSRTHRLAVQQEISNLQASFDRPSHPNTSFD
ncbi:choline kinase family protein [Microbulbifer sp. Q7]|uniref:choline kinase family protein n=1 Tax=Microbulbifer sp. Q7 TaxID=1785091 RepID=UPI00082BA181|nr:choline kinase family protein [Microbulbifer sp. Q7]